MRYAAHAGGSQGAGDYSGDLDKLKRRGVEDALAGKSMDPRYAQPGSSP